MEVANLVGVYNHPYYEDVYIIEMLITMRPDLIDFSSFYCIDPKKPKSDWQTAFGELCLSLDGLTILGDVANKHIINYDTTRVVFGLYAENLNIPLSTPFGEFILSPIEKLPNRLNSIAMNINLD